MKRTGRILLILLVITMIANVFGGCKKKDSGSTASAAKSSASKTTPKSSGTTTKSTGTTTAKAGTAAVGDTEPTGEEPAGEEPGDVPEEQGNQEQTIDYGGRSIVIVAQTNLAPGLPLSEAEAETSGDISKIMKYRSKLDTESRFNCKIEMKMIPIGSIITEVVNNQLAGTFLGDVLWANRQITIPKLINSKAILPWGDYHDFANDELYSGKFYRSVFYFKDKFWFISWGHQDGPFCGLHYNKAILANEGIPDLWAYADQNNWNWDTFRDIALKTTRDFNGDGTTDQWGIAAYSADFATMLGMTNGVAPIYFENNEAKFGFNDPKSRQALLFMIQLWNIDKVVMPVVATGGTHLNAYYGGKAVMLPSTGIAHGKAAADNGLDKSSIGYTYLPKGPNSDTYVAFTNTGGHGLFLMSSAQDPQNITQIIRYLMAVYDPTRNGYGFGTDLDSIERKFNELYVYDERSMDMVMRKSYPYVNVIDYGINYGIPLDWRNMINKLVSNQSTVASTLDEMSTLLTEKIRSVDSGAIF